MWLSSSWVLLILVGLARCEKNDEEDASAVFLEAAKSFFADRDNVNSLQGMASAFVQSNAGKQMSEIFSSGKSNSDGVGQILAGLGSLFAGNQNRAGGDYSMLGTILDNLVNPDKDNKRPTRDVEQKQGNGIDFESILSMGNMFLSSGGSGDLLMGFLPMLLQNLDGGSGPAKGEHGHKYDHSGHSWYMPPVLEHLHVMWDHFSNSELGQTLWKNSGLSKIVAQMSDPEGRIQYVKILDSFESPALRRRWIRSLTNYVAEWISYISDPAIQQRYLATVQFVGNSFLKSQGYPKSAMFDPNRPTESVSRLANAVAKRHLAMQIDSSLYIKPAVAYIQELIALASEKGFIMSRVNARELSNRLTDTINNDIIEPVLKAYRAYKWSVKSPQCSSQILCTINEEGSHGNDNESRIRSALLKVASFPAAWAVSNKLGINFWTLYGAIMEHEGCIQKYPAECTAFHEEEIRVTTESAHSEL